MGNELSPHLYSVEKVQEVDEETEREPVQLKKVQVKSKQKGIANKNWNKFIISYYDTSDSDLESQNLSLPWNQPQKYGTQNNNKVNTGNIKKSRLNQILKCNLYALIELATACLTLKIQKDLNLALNIWNETIITLNALSK